jgi:hypothetical protein
MQTIWSIVDLLRRKPHWWSPIISFAYGPNLESRMLDNGWVHYTDIKSDLWIQTEPRCAMGQGHSTCWHVEDFTLLRRLVSVKFTKITPTGRHACRTITGQSMKWNLGPHLVAAGGTSKKHMLHGTCPLFRQWHWSHCSMTVVMCWHVQGKTQIRFSSWKISQAFFRV